VAVFVGGRRMIDSLYDNRSAGLLDDKVLVARFCHQQQS
jgi:hypothetical protein